jgi:hypothetical protein
MKRLAKEIVDKKTSKVIIEAGKIVESSEIVKAAKIASCKYAMAHGSHRDHSSTR